MDLIIPWTHYEDTVILFKTTKSTTCDFIFFHMSTIINK